MDLTKVIRGIVQVTAEVRAMVGHSIHPEEPLMSAGLDSRGGMELRRALGETLGLDLPVTLLYDYQSILAIVTYINSLVEAQTQAQAQAHAADGVEVEAYWSDEQEEEGRAGPARRGVAALAEAAAEKPSKLLKTLRYVLQRSTCWPLYLLPSLWQFDGSSTGFILQCLTAPSLAILTAEQDCQQG